MADFSHHCLMWHLGSGLFRGLRGLDLSSLGLPTEQDHLRRHCERAGRGDHRQVMEDWSFYLAYNLFRLASITQGIAPRVLEGTASSAQARATAAATPELAQLAWSYARACS